MKEAIFNFLAQQKRPITFNELMRHFPDENGQKNFVVADMRLVIWDGISEDFAQALLDLAMDGVISLDDCPAEIYRKEGHYPQFPLAVSGKRYEHYHWLPLLISAINIQEVKLNS